MAIGDAQRVWYPEMLADLRRIWFFGMPWEEVIAFCGQMTLKRKELAIAKGVKPPMMKCKYCGRSKRTDYPTISVRSLIYALLKIKIISEEQRKEIDRDWRKYQRESFWDVYGNRKS